MKQTVLITGTSSGYGKATAELFLDRGWSVVATMRQPKPDIFGSQSDRLKVLPLDVTNSGSVSKAIAEAISIESPNFVIGIPGHLRFLADVVILAHV